MRMLLCDKPYVNVFFEMITKIKVDEIRKIIKDKHLSVAAAERKAGLKRNIIQNILYGRSKVPSLKTVQAIADALECNLEEIVDASHILQENKPPQTKTSWDSDIYSHAVERVTHAADMRGLVTFYEDMIPVINDAYLYAVENDLTTLDDPIINWLLRQHFKRI